MGSELYSSIIDGLNFMSLKTVPITQQSSPGFSSRILTTTYQWEDSGTGLPREKRHDMTWKLNERDEE